MSSVESAPIPPETLLSIKVVADAQLASDGGRVAFTVTETDAERDEYRTRIWVVPARGGEPTRFTRGPRRDTAPRWSPDGSLLAFLSDRDGKAAQLYVARTDGGEPWKLTALEHGAGPPVWSPDGTRLLFAARVAVTPPPAGDEARARWAQRPRVVTKALYKYDGAGYQLDTRSHLFVVVADAEGDPTQITDGECEDRAPAWSPDGRRVAWSRTRGGVADYNVSDIWVTDSDGGNPRQLTQEVGRATSPSWSPDGLTIACYGVDEQEPGLGEALWRVWTAPVAGGASRRVTADYDRGAFLFPPPAVNPGPAWSPDGTAVTFLAADTGNVHVVRVGVTDGRVRTVVEGDRQVWSVSLSPTGGRLAFVATELDNPGDLYACARDGSEEQRLTRMNELLTERLSSLRAERRAFPNPNGGTIDGWLIMPATGDAQVPLLVHIHGGPHAFVGHAFPHGAFYWYTLASRGWGVLALNPSGSGSYGKAFAHRLRARWGEYDLPEQLAAVDALVAEGIADPDRLAVAGYSYGGYMTAWVISHTDRFKAAVVGAPVTNLESFHGTSDIGMWFGPWEMKGDVVASRETYRRLSPVNYVERVTTPTLIVHGEADDRCPVGQGEELYVGLVAVGKTPAELVRYPGASHLFVGTGRPSHRVDYVRRVTEWVERHTLGSGP